MKTFTVSLILALTQTFAWAAPKIGEAAPGFSLPDNKGKAHTLADYKGKYIVLEWVNYGCPFVQKHYNSGAMQGLQKEIVSSDTVWLSICSSAPGNQGNMSADEWTKAIAEKKVNSTAVLLDPEGKVGRQYDAKTTPQMFIIDPSGKLIYDGAIDDKPTADQADLKTAKNYVKAAFAQIKAGKPLETAQTKSYGCSVKY